MLELLDAEESSSKSISERSPKHLQLSVRQIAARLHILENYGEVESEPCLPGGTRVWRIKPMPTGQKCGHCKQLGHNKRRCPERKKEDKKVTGDMPGNSPAPDQKDAPIESMVDASFRDALRADSGRGTATDRKGREIVEKTAAGFSEKMKSWLSKTEPISKTNFVRYHVRLNLLLHAYDIWVYSEPMLEVAKEMNEMDLSNSKKEGEIKWLSDPRLWWPRDHYDCWKLLYPNALRVPEFSKYGAVMVFFYHTAIITQTKYKVRVQKMPQDQGKPKPKETPENGQAPPQKPPEETPA